MLTDHEKTKATWCSDVQNLTLQLQGVEREVERLKRRIGMLGEMEACAGERGDTGEVQLIPNFKNTEDTTDCSMSIRAGGVLGARFAQAVTDAYLDIVEDNLTRIEDKIRENFVKLQGRNHD